MSDEKALEYLNKGALPTTYALIDAHMKAVSLLREMVAAVVRALPDNPRITRRDSDGKCFVINTGDLGPEANLSPIYHDFKLQHRCIARRIMDGGDPRTVIRGVIKRKKVLNDYYYTPSFIQVHPDVIEQLKRFLPAEELSEVAVDTSEEGQI